MFCSYIDFCFLSVTLVLTNITNVYALIEHPVSELEFRVFICCERHTTTFCNIICIVSICVVFAFISCSISKAALSGKHHSLSKDMVAQKY